MKYVKVEIRDQVQWVKLARPEKRNAFHPEMIAGLTQVFTNASSSNVRAVVLAGEGESFCAGGDLEWMRSMAKFSFEENKGDSEKLFDLYQTARDCPIPIVGHVHGHAFGGGIGLVAVCDIVAAEVKTQFCFSEVKWGLVPAVISSFVSEKMQPHKAREWMLTARVFSAPEALMSGLVHFVGDAAQIDQYVLETISYLKKAGPRSVAATKDILTYLNDYPRSAYRDHCTKVISETRVGEEGQAGLKAFLEKKPAPWA